MTEDLGRAADIAALERASGARTAARLLLFIALYLGAAAGAVLLAGALTSLALPAVVRVLLTLLLCAPLYLLAAAALHGISLFTHEGVHDALCSDRVLNHVFSALCAWPVLQNYAAYRVLHLRHHGSLGQDGDPDHYANYTSRRPLELAMHWGRLLLGYPAYITAIPVLAWRHGAARDRALLLLETLAVAALFTLVLRSPVPAAVLVHGWLIPMVLINTMVNIRGMSQHTLLPESSHVIRGTRTILTAPLVAFFMCNENLHLAHHLYPRVPWHSLPALQGLLHDELVAEGAPMIPSYWSFVREFLTGRRAAPHA